MQRDVCWGGGSAQSCPFYGRDGTEKAGTQIATAPVGSPRSSPEAEAERPAATPRDSALRCPMDLAGESTSGCSKRGVDHVLFLLKMFEMRCHN